MILTYGKAKEQYHSFINIRNDLFTALDKTITDQFIPVQPNDNSGSGNCSSCEIVNELYHTYGHVTATCLATCIKSHTFSLGQRSIKYHQRFLYPRIHWLSICSTKNIDLKQQKEKFKLSIITSSVVYSQQTQILLCNYGANYYIKLRTPQNALYCIWWTIQIS